MKHRKDIGVVRKWLCPLKSDAYVKRIRSWTKTFCRALKNEFKSKRKMEPLAVVPGIKPVHFPS
jgi:hypothetical protein